MKRKFLFNNLFGVIVLEPDIDKIQKKVSQMFSGQEGILESLKGFGQISLMYCQFNIRENIYNSGV